MNLNNGLKGKELSKIVLNFLLLQMYYQVLLGKVAGHDTYTSARITESVSTSA